ncbi:LysR substrate-binding domain-containing protein [Ramlibacter sp.]|uniref:LysR substrate-binding domain-containing protein n=1 Tax=Ramlibacter sp. TaxID=1917967 RepID=UPI0017AC3056|nr:LysR substrate-binding domain-containing protein [Ramlibacter sp.]MBA2672707.1 LysR family transcriptional regulator [Ramlibacter sp.]
MSNSLLRLPPLDLFRGFVAVGRRMSIKLAADDLCVTQSAVSRQIKALEEHLGVQLFVRNHRAIAFTPQGEVAFRACEGSLQQLSDLASALSAGQVRRPVTVSASIGVAALWLLPLLGDFQREHPQVDVRVAASNRILDLDREGIDLAIRYCPQSLAPAGATLLFNETIAPVAHPSVANGGLRTAAQLQSQVLLEYDDRHRPWLHWADWLQTAGWPGVQPSATIRFNQYDQVVFAALAGHGVALGRLELIHPLVDGKRLARVPMDVLPQTTQYGYWLVAGAQAARDDVQLLAQWVRRQAAQTY